MKMSEEIHSTNNIIDVISQYVTLKRSGSNYYGTCPFCGENSFSVSPNKKIYHCFSCGLGGSVTDFIYKMKNSIQ